MIIYYFYLCWVLLYPFILVIHRHHYLIIDIFLNKMYTKNDLFSISVVFNVRLLQHDLSSGYYSYYCRWLFINIISFELVNFITFVLSVIISH